MRQAANEMMAEPWHITPRREQSACLGYTLIEILTVIAISSILLSMALPRIRPALDRGRVNAAANVVAADLHYAQLMAVRSRRPVTIVVTSFTQQYVIRDRDDGSIVYRTRYLGDESEYRLETMYVSAKSIEMFPNGIARQSLTFTLGLHDYTRTVTFSRAGQIRVGS
jgi:prepilin-type N-terminal cleavage/methylation domain-containing protein